MRRRLQLRLIVEQLSRRRCPVPNVAVHGGCTRRGGRRRRLGRPLGLLLRLQLCGLGEEGEMEGLNPNGDGGRFEEKT